MKVVQWIALTTTLIFLSGCELTGPSVKVEPPKVKVDGAKVEGSNNKNGDFCPPGQAKKDRC